MILIRPCNNDSCDKSEENIYYPNSATMEESQYFPTPNSA